MVRRMSSALGRAIGRYLSQPVRQYRPLTTSHPDLLAATLQPGDILLVEGNTRVSSAIKYLTQSTWSHAALYVGTGIDSNDSGEPEPMLVEVDMVDGVR